MPVVEEVFCQLASELSVPELVVVGDSCLRRKAPLSTIVRLTSAVDDAAGRTGASKLRAAMCLVRHDTDSPMETVIRLALVEAGLPEPRVNHPIHTASGIVLHGDLVYPDERVIIEYDGDHHRTDAAQYFADVDRLWRLEEAAWRVIRVNRSHLKDGAIVVCERTRAAIAERGRTPRL